MNKHPSILMCVSALALCARAHAQTSIDRSFDSAAKDCSDVHWSQAALQAFPSIGSACQSVEQRNGKTYVKFEGTVESVKDQGKRVRVDFKDGQTLTFRPTPHTGLYINGERTDFADLNDGTKLNFYVPEDRLQAELQPDANRLAFIVVPLDMRDNMSANSGIGSVQQSSAGDEQSNRALQASNTDELPSTAGPLPLIGLSGFVLTLLGAGATLRRKLGMKS